MKDWALFLAGRYHARDFAFYRRLARGRIRVAVDGGYRYFERSRTFPHVLIGDFDSLRPTPRRLSPRTMVLSFPTDKDQTDTELALDHCLESGAGSIDIIQPTLGDPDHFLANLFLLTRKADSRRGGKVSIRLVGPRFEALYLEDGSHEFCRAGGSTVSVIPVSASIGLTCMGTAFDVSRCRVARGRTRSTRNRIITSRALFEVSGHAFLVRLYRRR